MDIIIRDSSGKIKVNLMIRGTVLGVISEPEHGILLKVYLDQEAKSNLIQELEGEWNGFYPLTLIDTVLTFWDQPQNRYSIQINF